MKTELENIRNLFIEHLGSAFETIDPESIDIILDNRDNEAFSELWMSAYNQTKDVVVDEEDLAKIDEIREAIFMLTFKETNSSDLSAYISDDVELICLHYLNKTENDWVAKLVATYLEHEIPQGVLKNTEKLMNDLVNRN